MSDIDPDENDVARVLRAAGGRAQPSDEMRQAVRAAVHAEWRATVRKGSERRYVWMALAASVMVAALGLWVARPYFVTREVVASVTRTLGSVESRSGSLGRWRTAPDVHAGDDVRTGADGRVALQLRDGVSLRLDHDTRVAFLDAGHIEVKSGAVYLDAGAISSAKDHLRVGTPAGVVQHVGTQYEARIVKDGVRIRVREGRVDLVPQHGNVQSAGMGEQLLISSSGSVQRDTIAPSDPQWEWAASTAPVFDINGRPVRDFLTWVGRELGREIVFVDAESEAEANRAVLSGSVAGLTPAEALPAVLATTQLRSTTGEVKIEVTRQPNR